MIGFVTIGRGITVHTLKCSRAVDVDPARKIPVSWDAKHTISRPVTLKVLTADRPGILATISQTFSENGVNISQANCKVTSADRALCTFEVFVQNTEQLKKVLGKLKALGGIYGVERT